MDWSIAELARRSGVDKTQLSRMLAGERRWLLEHVQAVAYAFGLPAEELVAGTEQEGLLQTRIQAEENVEVLAPKLAAALAALRGAQAASKWAAEELAKRPTCQELTSIEREREALRTELTAAVRELEAARGKVGMADAQLRELEFGLGQLLQEAEELRSTALLWQLEAKGLGSRANLPAVSTVAFTFRPVTSGTT